MPLGDVAHLRQASV